MVGEKPVIVAVMRRETVHQLRDLVLLSDPAGAADHTVGIRGGRDHQRIARPAVEMGMQSADRGFGPARERQVEEPDMTGLARWQTGGHVFRRRQAARAAAALPSRISTWALPAWQGEARVSGEGAIKRLDRARIYGERRSQPWM